MKHRIKIAVAIDGDGDWSCCGWGNVLDGKGTDKDAMGIAGDTLGEGERHYWVEAEIEMPEIQTIQGEVKEDVK